MYKLCFLIDLCLMKCNYGELGPGFVRDPIPPQFFSTQLCASPPPSPPPPLPSPPPPSPMLGGPGVWEEYFVVDKDANYADGR